MPPAMQSRRARDESRHNPPNLLADLRSASLKPDRLSEIVGDVDVDFTKALAGVAALAVGIGALATTTGTFNEMQRGSPIGSSIIFGIAAVAGTLVLAAGLLNGWIQGLLVGLGILLFICAVVAAILVLGHFQSD